MIIYDIYYANTSYLHVSPPSDKQAAKHQMIYSLIQRFAEKAPSQSSQSISILCHSCHERVDHDMH